jgi:carbamate kinase
MKLVVALGGNALLRRAQTPTAGHQLDNIRSAVAQIARVAADHALVLTHGNGPQVGLLALQSAAYATLNPAVPGYPLDVLDAESQGMLGYLLEQELANLLPPERAVVTLLTRVEVDAADPAFAQPHKPIGAMLTPAQAEDARRTRGWTTGPDGDGLRRLVASPHPLRVLAQAAIGWLLAQGAVVIAAGGGGIPVVRRTDGPGHVGIDAVIDKDWCSALLATELQADCLVIATDVDAVYLDWGLPGQRAVGRTSVAALEAQRFAAGSMAPKVAAACDFVRRTGRRAAIGALAQIEDLLAGTAGTQITAAP